MKRVKILVKPTEQEVRDGTPMDVLRCPYASATRRALRAATGRYSSALVGRGDAWGCFDGCARGWYQPLSRQAKQRVDRFDDLGDRTSPWPGFYLTIEVPESQGSEP